jgi:hypothetical protein
MEKKQTAVEWLAERCGLQALEDVIAEAKQMEKEQILDSWDDGYSCGMYQEGLGIDYYNETYGGQDENP